MEIRHEHGYSADVESFFVTDGNRFRLAKSNDATLVLAEPCELPPGIEGELLIIVDGRANSQRIVLPEGVGQGQTSICYSVVAPF